MSKTDNPNKSPKKPAGTSAKKSAGASATKPAGTSAKKSAGTSATKSADKSSKSSKKRAMKKAMNRLKKELDAVYQLDPTHGRENISHTVEAWELDKYLAVPPQGKDLVLKTRLRSLQGREIVMPGNVKFRIDDLRPSEFPVIVGRNRLADSVFYEKNDKGDVESIVFMEFVTNNDSSTLFAIAERVALGVIVEHEAKRLQVVQNNGKIECFPQLRCIVIYTSGIQSTPDILTTRIGEFRVEQVFLGSVDGEQKFQEITDTLKQDQKLSGTDSFMLGYLPLTFSDSEDQSAMIEKIIAFAETYFPERKQQYYAWQQMLAVPGLSDEECATIRNRMDILSHNLGQYGASMTDICVSCKSIIQQSQISRIIEVTTMVDALTEYYNGIREYALKDAGYYDLRKRESTLRAENSGLRKRESGLLNIIDGMMVNLSEAQQAEIREQLNSLSKTAGI